MSVGSSKEKKWQWFDEGEADGNPWLENLESVEQASNDTEILKPEYQVSPLNSSLPLSNLTFPKAQPELPMGPPTPEHILDDHEHVGHSGEMYDSKGIPVSKHDIYLANGFFFLTVLLLFSLAGAQFLRRRRVTCLGLAGLATLLGLVCGAGLHLAGAETILEKVLEFNDDVFFFLLLPPIIFQGAVQLDSHVFFKNIGTIVWLAVAATLLSFLFVAGSIFLSGQLQLMENPWTITESLAFASVISATDPVAVLAVLRQLPGLASPLLTGLISGESLLNDAICLVLYRSIVRLKDQSLVHALQTFGVVFVESCILGAAVAFIAALVFKYT